ncbi:MAG: GntR family transcriptional regulator [Corynebacterium sp.]|nr:GntR family transcriptional regulator [Corynebacterium sp.]
MTGKREPQRHVKIGEYIKAKIMMGELEPGDFLPSEAELCEQFQTSRGPVRQALATLRTQGMISSGRGRRSVVLPRQMTGTFDTFISNHAWLTRNGWEVSSKTLWMARCPAPANAAAALKIAEGDPIVYIHRIRMANGVPIVNERSYFPLEIGRHVLLMDPDKESLHSHLREEGIGFDHCHQEISAQLADETDIEHLGLNDNSIVMVSKITIANHNGETLEYSEQHHVMDGLSISFNVINGEPSSVQIGARGSDRYDK